MVLLWYYFLEILRKFSYPSWRLPWLLTLVCSLMRDGYTFKLNLSHYSSRRKQKRMIRIERTPCRRLKENPGIWSLSAWQITVGILRFPHLWLPPAYLLNIWAKPHRRAAAPPAGLWPPWRAWWDILRETHWRPADTTHHKGPRMFYWTYSDDVFL